MCGKYTILDCIGRWIVYDIGLYTALYFRVYCTLVYCTLGVWEVYDRDENPFLQKKIQISLISLSLKS